MVELNLQNIIALTNENTVKKDACGFKFFRRRSKHGFLIRRLVLFHLAISSLL